MSLRFIHDVAGIKVHPFLSPRGVPSHELHHSWLNHPPIGEHLSLPGFGSWEWSCDKYLHTSYCVDIPVHNTERENSYTLLKSEKTTAQRGHVMRPRWQISDRAGT